MLPPRRLGPPSKAVGMQRELKILNRAGWTKTGNRLMIGTLRQTRELYPKICWQIIHSTIGQVESPTEPREKRRKVRAEFPMARFIALFGHKRKHVKRVLERMAAEDDLYVVEPQDPEPGKAKVYIVGIDFDRMEADNERREKSLNRELDRTDRQAVALGVLALP